MTSARAWGPDGPEESEAKRLARALGGTIPVVIGAGRTAAAARRWKTQINENASAPSGPHSSARLASSGAAASTSGPAAPAAASAATVM